MPKTRCTDVNRILSRNLKYFELKSERNLCEIYKILRSPFGIRFRTYLKNLHKNSDLVKIWNRNMIDFKHKSNRNLKEILQISIQIRCVFLAELGGNLIVFEVMMPKKHCTYFNQILSRNLKYFEHKSERNLCEMYKILRRPF